MANGIQVGFTGFNRAANAIIGQAGTDAAGNNLEYDLAANVGVAIGIPPTQYGAKITGLSAIVDQNNNLSCGLRVVVVAYPGQLDTISKLVQSWDQRVGGIRQSTQDGLTGLIIPDLTTMALNPALGLGSTVFPGAVNGGYLMVDDGEPSQNGAWGPSGYGNNTPNQSAHSYKNLFAEGGLEIPPQWSAMAVFIALRSTTLAALGTATPKITGTVIRGTAHGYYLSQKQAIERTLSISIDPATGALRYQSSGLERTPARFGNVGIPGATG